MERANGAMVLAKPYVEVNWTKGIDQKTGKPIDYDPDQGHPDLCRRRQSDAGRAAQEGLPVAGRRQQLLAFVLQPEDEASLYPGSDDLRDRHHRPRKAQPTERGWNGGLSQTDERWESNLTAVDPLTGEIKKNVHLRYPNYSGTLATAGGLVFLALLDGTRRGL